MWRHVACYLRVQLGVPVPRHVARVFYQRHAHEHPVVQVLSGDRTVSVHLSVRHIYNTNHQYFELTVHFKHEMMGIWQRFQRNFE